MQSDIIVGYSTDGCERNDIMMAWDDVDEMAREAGYRQQEAHIEITRIFSFGRSTCRVVVRRVSTVLTTFTCSGSETT